MLQPGTHIGRYEIQRRLGRGGMGDVYVAHDPLLGRMVAIKVFQGDVDVADASSRFAREARSAAALNHANIVTVYDYGEFDGQPFIVMEYVQGETLASIIRRKAPADLPTRLRWMEELVLGVAYAHHGGVVHRDIKPGNLMVNRSGRLKILDFGVARMLGTLSTSGTALVGTPGYMAPEQILGTASDHRADLFSVGVVVYECVSYTGAFAGETLPAVAHRILSDEPRPLAELCPDASPKLVALVERALRKSAAERFPDADAMIEAIREVRRDTESSTTVWLAPTVLPFKVVEVIEPPDARPAVHTTPQPTPSSDRPRSSEELARVRREQVELALQRCRSSLDSGRLDEALDACLLALTLDEQNAAAHDLDREIRARQAERRAESMVQDARAELDRGSLTVADGLLRDARALVPDSPELRRLERDLRLARVEQERLQQRAQMVRGTLDQAEGALESGNLEMALALAREALALDPMSERATAVANEATRRLDIEVEPTVISPGRSGSAGGAATPVAIGGDVPMAPTVIVRTPRNPQGAKAGATGLARPLVPARSSHFEPFQAGLLRHGRAAAEAVRSGASTVVAQASAWMTRAGAAALSRGGRTPASARWLGPLSGSGPDVNRRRFIAAGVATGAAAVALAVVAVTRVAPAPPPPPVASGHVVIEAVPWASVTGIERADGSTVQTAADASTPFTIDLPAGSYRIHVTGPPPESQGRVLTVEARAGETRTVTADAFPELNPEAYFEQYLGPEAAGAAATPAGGPNSGDGQ